MTEINPADAGGRDTQGRFRKGQSGNPHGRPQGARKLLAQRLDQLAEGEAEAVFAAVVERAKAGDVDAAKVVLARAWPVRRGRPVRLDLPLGSSPAVVTEAAMRAVAEGQLTAEEGEAFVRTVEAHANVVKIGDIAARLEALEAERAAPRLRPVA